MVSKNKSGPESKKSKKLIQSIYRENECNLKIVDYLAVTSKHAYSSYRPFNKTNNEINYIHKHSNHPPSIIKQLHLSVKRRLSKLSSNEKIFNYSIPTYQETLVKAGCKHKLTYQKQNQKNTSHDNAKNKSFG